MNINVEALREILSQLQIKLFFQCILLQWSENVSFLKINSGLLWFDFMLRKLILNTY